MLPHKYFIGTFWTPTFLILAKSLIPRHRGFQQYKSTSSARVILEVLARNL